MKNFLLAFVAGLIPALALTNDASAQTSNLMAYKDAVNNYFKIGNTDVTENVNTVSLEMVNAKALKIFSKKYKVTGEKWSQGKDCITASYVLDGINETIYFDKKGNWEASLKTYQEDLMPKDIRKMVRQEYYDYKIMFVREIKTLETGENPQYLINIQDEHNVKEIRIQGFNMDVYNEFTKS